MIDDPGTLINLHKVVHLASFFNLLVLQHGEERQLNFATINIASGGLHPLVMNP
jgi:hypothetical protein